jgi:uncharacterized protein (TIGR02145 family)
MHPISFRTNKVLLIICLLAIGFAGFSQAPNLLNYQGVARNAVGNPLPNQAMNLRLSVHNLSASGTVVYSETRPITTNLGGLFSVQIGSAGTTSSTGTIGGVNWLSGDKFLQVEIDPISNNNYLNLGTVQLVAVPYAFNAATAGNAATATKLAAPKNINGVVFDGSADITITTLAAAEQLTGTTLKSTITGSSLMSVGTLTNLTVTNPIVGSITGNAATATTASTVTTNANLTGDVTSVGNATTIANNAVTMARIVDGAITNAKITDVSATKITGTLPVANGGTGAATDAAARTNLGLGNVDNTSDAAKSISILTQTALDLKAPLASPTLTGTPLAPTAAAGTNTTQIATTQFVTGAITTAKAGVVPYTGATQAVDLGAYNLTVNGVSVGTGSGVNASSNAAIGNDALSQNTTGVINTALGLRALSKNTIGSYNTATGAGALSNNIDGNYNTANGMDALTHNMTGWNNTANGERALFNNTTGGNNTATGNNALSGNTTGTGNIAVGYEALSNNIGGTFNTAVGYGANVVSGSGDLINSTAIGWGAQVAASHTIQLGNTSVTAVNTSGTITAAGFSSTVATGTAPLVVTSTTPVANLSIGGNAATATTVTAASQPAITSVGILTNATISGKVIVGASSAASSSAVLEASSTTQGFLPPRMNYYQKTQITSPVAGLTIWCSTCGVSGEMQVFNGGAWTNMIGGSATPELSTVVIGTQQWMEKNLEVVTYRNGDVIPQVTDLSAWYGLTTGAWCYYNNDPLNGAIYGKLYNWYAVNDPRGLAPAGWHIPTDEEWTTLSTLLGGESAAGGKMKTTGTTRWTTPNTSATNESGFAGLPGGLNYGLFAVDGNYGFWWSATESSPTYAWGRSLVYNVGGLNRLSANNKMNGFSVRCLRN